MNDDMNKNELIVKSNRLIEASYRLTLAEQRIILFAITEARETEKGLSESSILTIKAADYAETYGITKRQAYEQLREAADTLFLRYVILNDIHEESGAQRKMKVRWVSMVAYVCTEGIIQLRFAYEMVPYITRLEVEFTKYKLEIVARMSSVYAIRIYELLIQWNSVGQREIEIEELKKILMVENEYPRIFSFKKRVIDVALAQINEFSDIKVDYTQRKTGREVTHFIFKFDKKVEPKAENKPAQKKLAASNSVQPFDKSAATMKEKVEAFLAGNERFNRRFPNIAPHIAWGTPVIRAEFQSEFEEWLLR